MHSDIERLQETIGLHFKDQALLQEALVHRSFLNENPDFILSSNERLEFLGDALLDLIVGEYLYQSCPEMDEGDLTSLRSALVRRDTLAQFARQLQLGEHLLMGHGEAESGGRERSATLCAAIEALVGAVYLDQGLAAVETLMVPLIEPETGRILRENLDKDAKSLLQETAQATWQLTPRYRTVEEVGPDHAKEFTVEVMIGDRAFGQGVGRSKQLAAQAAAWEALERIEAEMNNTLNDRPSPAA